jgi:hypothetical protein
MIAAIGPLVPLSPMMRMDEDEKDMVFDCLIVNTRDWTAVERGLRVLIDINALFPSTPLAPLFTPLFTLQLIV